MKICGYNRGGKRILCVPATEAQLIMARMTGIL
jgi:hypothetical protein